MRKKGIIALAVLTALIIVIAYLFRDSAIENMIEKMGQDIAGAKVEIDNFHFSLLKMECSWDRLQIADLNDTMFNLIETGKASFDLEVRPLFWKRVVIREIILEGLLSGTQRETDGSLPIKEKAIKKGVASKAVGALERKRNRFPRSIFPLSAANLMWTS